MDIQSNTSTLEISFKDFLFKNRRNRTILCLAAAAIVIQFAIFKYLYPFASFIHGDSFAYIKAAYQNLDINTYPIGYSRFLRLFSVFTKSDTALVAFQYLFLQISTLLLLFTIFYFYKARRITQYVLICFMVLNPLFLHLSNLISSDCLFVGLSMTWFTLLLWIINKPSNKIIIWHAIVLLLAFIVRYNGIVYPLISVAAFWISALPLRKKIFGSLTGALLCSLFVCFTCYQYKKLTGYWQFSPFSGWLMTNNAMYAYRYVKSADRKPVPKKFQILDNMIREYFDSTRDIKKFPVEAMQASTFYMWSPSLPMVKYQNGLFKKDTTAKEFKKWASMGSFYKEYGLYIIKHYPWTFIRYYIWPNANKYYAPPVEFLEKYNSGNKGVTTEAKLWFQYQSTEVKTRVKNKEVWVLSFYPILSGIINLVMLCLLTFFALLKGWKHQNHFSKGVFLSGLLWLINASFTIFVSSAALRFQSFPILLTVIFVTLLVDWMYFLMHSLQQQEKLKLANEGRNIKEEIIVSTSL